MLVYRYVSLFSALSTDLSDLSPQYKGIDDRYKHVY